MHPTEVLAWKFGTWETLQAEAEAGVRGDFDVINMYFH